MRSIARSRSSASWSSSSRPDRRSPWWSKGTARSQRCARRSARRIPRTPSRARSGAISPLRCRTIWCTGPTRRTRRRARSRSGSRTMSSSERPDYVQQNVANWTRANAEYTDASAARAWAEEEIRWGVWRTPESDLNVLGDVDGLDIVELGCGTAYFSAWLARRGARVVGVDPTPAQLATARRLQQETGLEFPLIEAYGEDVPLPDASFDMVHSEYGASIWADPYRWIPEAARLLRPGGRLIFLCNSTISILTMTLKGGSTELQRPQNGMHKIEWPDTHEVEFHIAHSD